MPSMGRKKTPQIFVFSFSRYGQRQWKNKEDCWGILESFCDLTNETSDIQEPYYGRVRTISAGIRSDWTMTQRFTPWWESEFHGVPLHLLFPTPRSPIEQALCLLRSAPSSPLIQFSEQPKKMTFTIFFL